MKIAYLTNQYPHVRHTFIRREIVALEALGVQVTRFSIRDSGRDVVDPADIAERSKTHALLGEGKFRLLLTLVGAFFTRPIRFLKALATATDRGTLAGRPRVDYFIILAAALWTAHNLPHDVVERFSSIQYLVVSNLSIRCPRMDSLYSFKNEAHSPSETSENMRHSLFEHF